MDLLWNIIQYKPIWIFAVGYIKELVMAVDFIDVYVFVYCPLVTSLLNSGYNL